MNKISIFFLLLVCSVSPALAAGDYFAGYAAFQSKDYYHAYKEWAEAAKAGDRRSMFRLGRMFEMGQGLPKRSKHAFKLYRKAANLGHKPSVKSLVAMSKNGDENAERWVKNHPKIVMDVTGTDITAAKAKAEAEDDAEKEESTLYDLINSLLK